MIVIVNNVGLSNSKPLKYIEVSEDVSENEIIF